MAGLFCFLAVVAAICLFGSNKTSSIIVGIIIAAFLIFTLKTLGLLLLVAVILLLWFVASL